MPLNAWCHVALVRYNGVWTLYQNGVPLAQYTGGTFGNNTYPFNVGNWGGANAAWQGYIDEVRVSNIARYTGAFAVPTAPFTLDANTMALLHFDSGVSGLTADSSASISQQLNTAINTSTPSIPNVSMATDGTPLSAAFSTTADAGSTIQGVLLLASGSRNAGTSTTNRLTLQDQAQPPNQQLMGPFQFPAGAYQYGKVLGFLPNALDGSTWSPAKIAALAASLTSLAS